MKKNKKQNPIKLIEINKETIENEIALQRSKDPNRTSISHNDLKQSLGL